MAVVADPGSLGEIPLFKGLTLEQLSRLNDLLRLRRQRSSYHYPQAGSPR